MFEFTALDLTQMTEPSTASSAQLMLPLLAAVVLLAIGLTWFFTSRYYHWRMDQQRAAAHSCPSCGQSTRRNL